MRRQGVIVYDVLEFRAVRNLLCRDNPFPCLLKALGNGVGTFANGVAGTVIRYGSVDAIGTLAFTKPCSSLLFGRCEAVDIGGQRSNNLLRSVAHHFKNDTYRRLLYTRSIVIAVVLELRNLEVKSDGGVGDATLELNDAHISKLFGADGIAQGFLGGQITLGSSRLIDGHSTQGDVGKCCLAVLVRRDGARPARGRL